MYRRQIATIFSNYGLDYLYEKYEVPLDIHGLLDDSDTSESIEVLLTVNDIQSNEPACFDEFLAYYTVCNHMMKHNPDLPIDSVSYTHLTLPTKSLV